MVHCSLPSTMSNEQLWRFLQIGSFFWNNCSFDWANLHTDSAINAGSEVNPVPVCAFGIFTRPFVNTGDWTSIDTISDAFTDVGNNGVWHSVLSLQDRSEQFGLGFKAQISSCSAVSRLSRMTQLISLRFQFQANRRLSSRQYD